MLNESARADQPLPRSDDGPTNSNVLLAPSDKELYMSLGLVGKQAIFPCARLLVRHMPENHSSFGSELFDMRSAKGMTQLEIASRANLGRGYYSQLENSKKGPPSPAVLQRIVYALELSNMQAQRLLAAAVAERCAAACESTWACESIAVLVKTVIRSASRVTQAKAARIEAILEED